VALGTSRLLSSFLYGVEPSDPLTFVGVAVLLAVVAIVACLRPAIRATAVDPIEVLKAE
jgi:putative ABC transport system permease protein